MPESNPKLGTIAWVDLTVTDAPRVRDFYQAVIGWEPSPVKMGDYDDFNMKPPGAEKAAAGVCHARGENAALPPQWLIYVPVKDLAASIETCERLGGSVVARIGKSCCVVRDPAGAVMAIMQAD
jgi:predicted enzyme related to lactoylglutathione lyase